MTLSQLTIIGKLEVIAFCQYSDKLSSYIADLCLTGQAMRFAERPWILSFSLGLLLRIHPLWWKYPHDP